MDESSPARHDAAMDLAAYDQGEAEQALAKVALDPTTDELIADACGESLGEIWCRKGRINYDILKQLHGIALRLAVGYVKKFKPEWESQVRQTLRDDPSRADEWDKT